MLTQTTISGYKSLLDTSARFGPFTVIVGRNNVGKSNLFDALRLLSNLARMPAASAFRPEHHRGDPVESFFSESRPELRITCDFDLTGTRHPYDSDAHLSHPILHYEVSIVFQNGMLQLKSEKLRGRTTEATRPRPFLSADGDGRVAVNRDTARRGRSRHFAFPSPRSALTMVDDAELYPHLVALARELSSWRFFQFEPEALREPSPAMDILEIEPNGRGLSGFYDTLQKKAPDRFRLAERALRRGIPEAERIRVLDTGDRRRLLAIVTQSEREFTARVLSDGTLRYLALLALAYSPQPPGLVCFEEPENGVPPARMPFIVDTLRGLSERGAGGGPRSQVLVNSHSPYLVDLLEPAEMLVATLNDQFQTRFASVGTDLFHSRPLLRKILEDGEQTLGELWAQGSFDAAA